jgi:hypothetical protein
VQAAVAANLADEDREDIDVAAEQGVVIRHAHAAVMVDAG